MTEFLSRKHTIFRAGYAAAAPILHYNRQKFLEETQTEEERNFLLSMPVLKTAKNDPKRAVQEAMKLGAVFNASEGEIPSNYAGYIQWLEHYVRDFEEKYPMSRIEHYYFLFSRKLAELCSCMNICALSCRLQAHFRHSANVPKILLSIHNAEHTLLKLVAASALLGGEAGHYYFNVLFSELKSAFAKFKINVSELDRKGLENMAANAEDYIVRIVAGVDKCDMILKELKV
jgi:hypothetical protein